MSKAKKIKDSIKGLLQELVNSEVLGELQVDDYKTPVGILDRNFTGFPAAVLTGPSIDAGRETNRDNLRTYSYEIIVIQKSDNISEDNPIEDLIEAIVDKFDKDDLQGGVASKIRQAGAEGGVDPINSPVEVGIVRGQTLSIFSVILKAKGLYESA